MLVLELDRSYLGVMAENLDELEFTQKVAETLLRHRIEYKFASYDPVDNVVYIYIEAKLAWRLYFAMGECTRSDTAWDGVLRVQYDLNNRRL